MGALRLRDSFPRDAWGPCGYMGDIKNCGVPMKDCVEAPDGPVPKHATRTSESVTGSHRFAGTGGTSRCLDVAMMQSAWQRLIKNSKPSARYRAESL